MDRKLLYPAVTSILQNDDSVARGSLGRIYGLLTERDLAALLPSIVKATDQLAPSDEMFGDGIRLAGLDLLSRLHIREGMPLCVSVIEPDRWGVGHRLEKCLECLGRYGARAKEVLPQLKKMREEFAKAGRGKVSDQVQLLDKSVAAIEASKELPAVVDMKKFIAQSSSVR